MSSYSVRFSGGTIYVMAALLLGTVLTVGAADHSLSILWDTSIAVAGSDRAVSVCVAPRGGRVYVADAKGEWVVLSRRGAILLRKADPAIAGSKSLACSDDGRLWVVLRDGRSIAIYSSELQPVGRRGVPLVIRRIYSGHNGTLYATGLNASGPLHVLHENGEFRSLGSFPPYLSAEERAFHGANARAVVDEAAGRIYYKPQSPFVIYVFDLNGSLLETKDLGDSTFNPAPPTRQADGATVPLIGDVTGAFFKLPSGGYVIQVVRARSLKEGLITQEAQFEFFDSAFERQGAPVVPVNFGSLAAVDDEGNIYGLMGVPSIRLVKATIR